MSRRQASLDVFAALADPTRRAILERLRSGEQPVMALAAQFDVTLSAISQHIRILRDVGLVTARKAGRERVYRLNAAPLQPVAEWIRVYEPFWNDKLDALEIYLDRTAAEQPGEAAPQAQKTQPTQKRHAAHARRTDEA